MTALLHRHPWLAVPLLLLAYAAPGVIDATAQWLLG